MPVKILVVEDDVAMIQMIKTSLEHGDDEVYEVLTAGNGRDGYERAVTEKPDVIVMDVMMPVLDGFETLKQLKETPATAEIPVVMLTGLDDDTHIAEGWRKGASLYLRKPFVPIQLISYLKLALDK